MSSLPERYPVVNQLFLDVLEMADRQGVEKVIELQGTLADFGDRIGSGEQAKTVAREYLKGEQNG